jgi:predicted butyrate kinase (DUF1464 family)
MAKQTEVVRLPMPDHLEPKSTSRSLSASVKIYFYTLYNETSGKFRELLASIGNKDAIHKNRLFDRHYAVGMVKDAAKKSGDAAVANAVDGDIYKCIVNLMRGEGLSLKLRRQAYANLTHQAPAE